jgi:hypothetical protein
MKTNFSIVFLLIIAFNGFSQQTIISQKSKPKFNGSMERRMQPGLDFPDYPQLELTNACKAIELPPVVDNSGQPYLRPVFSQQGASCGQAASVGYNFCYEINRLRDLPADTSINQYPDHFVWNFMNATAPYYGEGVSYFHTYDILYEAGNPTEDIYGPITMDDSYHWMSGYDGYFQAMHNRISGVSSINVATPEGLTILKHWLHNHLEGFNVGGVANYYAGQAYSPQPLPEGTPEAGKFVHLLFGPISSHALTIVGYNDSIRYDVNGDGIYTNNLDITGDTIVDMKDWEIGGLKYVNSYGSYWADSGFCYMLYRTLAIKYGEGGIWNNSVHVLHPDTVAKPLLTIKTTIKHNKRGRISLQAGITSDTSQYYPSNTLSFSVFDYQGGDYFMTGSNATEGKTLELGLDITPLLSFTKSGEPYRVFLMVDENDPDGSGEGFVLDYSVISYLGQEGIEFISDDGPLKIADNDRTIVSVKVDNGINPISILPEENVITTAGTNTATQFSAEGGFPPYTWSLKHVFTETESLAAYNPPEGTVLEPTDISSGFAAIPLPFNFPFFGQQYDTLYMHVNGYLLFDQQDMPYYYLLFDENYLRQVRAIAGYMNYNLALHSNGDYISYNTYQDSVVFNWKISKSAGNGNTKFSTTIFPDGRIKHHYGLIDSETTFMPVIGLSDGTRESTRLSVKNGIIPKDGSIICFIPAFLPDKISITENGLLEIQADTQPFCDKIIVTAHDSQRVFSEKSILLTTGPEIIVSLAGSPTYLPPGDIVPLVIEITNRGNDTLTGMVVDVKALTLNATIIGNDFGVIDLLPGQSVVLDSEFSVQISDTLSSPQMASIDVIGKIDNFIFHTYKDLHIEMPMIVVSPPVVNDGNNMLPEPDEECELIFRLFNYGRISAGELTIKCSVLDTYAGLSGLTSIKTDELKGLSTTMVVFNMKVNSAAPLGGKIRLMLDVTNDDGIIHSEEFKLSIGQTPIVLIDLDKNHNSSLHIGSAINALNTNFDRFETIHSEILDYDIVFLSLGYLPNNYNLRPEEDSLMLAFLDKGGNLYVEGGSFYKYSPATMLRSRLRVEGAWDAVYTPADTIVGIDGTPAEGFAFDYRGDNVLGENLLPLEPAVPWLTDKNTGFYFTVALDSGTYRTIASSVEFGGSFPFNGPERPDMIRRYLDFFGYQASPLVANFRADSTFICKGSVVHFEPFCSGNPISYHWDFEGGTPDVFDGPNPSITYENPGSYGVSLTVSDGISDNTFSLNDLIIADNCLGIGDNPISKLRFYPNPAKDFVIIETSADQKASIIITDLSGRIVLTKTIPAYANEIRIPVNHLAKGCYTITLTEINQQKTAKLNVF